jgi:protein involved in sex pheromone biosynthesis
MNVRNKLAHQWSPTEAEYKNKSLSENFLKFKHDLKDSFIVLINIYGKEQDDKLTRYSYELDKGNYNTFLA